MRVKPVLGDWEIPRIASIRTLEQRQFVELAVPGRRGSLFQDLDTVPTRVAITGSLYGQEAHSEFLETLREKFLAGEPVTFVADILTATEIQYVIIERLHLQESGQQPDQLDYTLVLRESPPPPPPSNPLGDLDTDLLDQAGDFLDTVTGSLDAIAGLGSIPDIADPTPQVSSALDGVTAATSGLQDALDPLQAIFGRPEEDDT